MHLNHLSLPVRDLTGARDLFARLFDFRTVDQHGNAVAVMTDGAGFTLVLSDAAAFGGGPPRYPDGFHVGFILQAPAQVDAAHRRLAAAGIDTPPPRNLRGGYTFYFTALDTILFEVSCPLPRTAD